VRVSSPVRQNRGQRSSQRSWTVIRSPNPGKQSDFTAVSCWTANGCLAVGSDLNHGIAAAWNGSSWTLSPPPAALTEPGAVSCAGRFDCWATGYGFHLVPYAAHWPYEVHFYPHQRVPDLPALSDAARSEFGEIYLDVLRRFDRLFDTPAPYISAWHQAPVRHGRDDFAVHLELFTIRRAPGKLKYLAGSESGMGAFANDVSPEAAAQRLRDLA